MKLLSNKFFENFKLETTYFTIPNAYFPFIKEHIMLNNKTYFELNCQISDNEI